MYVQAMAQQLIAVTGSTGELGGRIARRLQDPLCFEGFLP